MKKNLVFAVVLLILQFGYASDFKEINKDVLRELKTSVKMDASTKALINAITNNDVKKLVLNREIISKHNDIFNLKVKAEGITNQKSTGRCWMFAGLNTLRPVVIEKNGLKSFEFSEAYLFFWDKLEKANFFLESIINTRDRDIDDREIQALLSNPVPDGGWWNYFVTITNKYGLVPKNVMPENVNSSKSRMMNKTVNNLVRRFAAELRSLSKKGKSESDLRKRKAEMVKQVYRILVLHFGNPPDHFIWRFEDKDKNLVEKSYTPLEFFHQAVGINLDDYITLVDYPVHPYNEKYQINFCRNMPEAPDMTFINLDIDKLKSYALKALKAGDPVWFAADAGWQMDRDKGIMADGLYDYNSLFNLKGGISKAERVQYRISIPNHAMVFVGADIKDDKVLKWKVENSWGKDKGDSGYWSMYDNWFDKYVFVVIMHKKYLSETDLDILKKKAKKIPAWDPLRTFF